MGKLKREKSRRKKLESTSQRQQKENASPSNLLTVSEDRPIFSSKHLRPTRVASERRTDPTSPDASVAPPALALLPEEGGSPDPAPSADASVGSEPVVRAAARTRPVGARENRLPTPPHRAPRRDDGSGFWSLLCCGASSSCRPAGYDAESDDELEEARAESVRCDVCGVRSLGKGWALSLCCQEPTRTKVTTVDEPLEDDHMTTVEDDHIPRDVASIRA